MKVKPITVDDLTGETEKQQCIQRGRKEVVEWIQSHEESSCMDCTCAYDFKRWDWQAKLKEWRIE